MDLDLRPYVTTGYTSLSQVARVTSEAWGAENLYCAACTSDRVEQTPNNTRAVDYTCRSCGTAYQLKSGLRWDEQRVPDAGYEAMIASILSDNTPNLLVMQYTPDWQVRNLLLVPSFFMTTSVIEARKPLSPLARRAGWVGCNIVVGRVPTDGKLSLVSNSVVTGRESVRRQYQMVKPFADQDVGQRGWTLSVLAVVRRLEKEEFLLRDVYAFEDELAQSYPANRHVRQKIRQQLQVLRDLGFLEFQAPGHYRVTKEHVVQEALQRRLPL